MWSDITYKLVSLNWQRQVNVIIIQASSERRNAAWSPLREEPIWTEFVTHEVQIKNILSIL
jgi:hypothetical protein